MNTIKDKIFREVLPFVRAPQQYAGGELNAIIKPASSVDVSIALAFPDTYAIGMSHLGLKLLYQKINELEFARGERVFALEGDISKILAEKELPLYSLETFTPLSEFDAVGFSLQFELCATTVLTMLDMANIPVLAEDRTDAHPLILAGGTCALQPEPMSDFIDLFFLGDCEESIVEFCEVYRELKASNLNREEKIIEIISRIEGVYAPSLYKVEYNDDDTIRSVSPKFDNVPKTIKRRIVEDMSAHPIPTKWVVPYIETVHDRIAIEIMRGCVNGCRFCFSGMTTRPMRIRSIDEIVNAAIEGVKATGFDEIGLLSLSSSDYPEIKMLLSRLHKALDPLGVSISMPSLRVNEALANLPEDLNGAGRRSGLTMAVEVASEKLRLAINKPLKDEELLAGARAFFERGYRAAKLYMMIGMPFETDEDCKEITLLAQRVANTHREVAKGPASVNVSLNVMVPKAHTPMQWAEMISVDEAARKRDVIRDAKKMKCVALKFGNLKGAVLEGVLARGDRRLGKVIYRVFQKGATLEGWRENFNPRIWEDAFEQEGIDPDFYTSRKRSREEIFPWEHINVGVSKSFLLQEWERYQTSDITKSCLDNPCHKCDACTPEMLKEKYS